MKCGRYFLGGSSPAGHKNHFNALISDTEYYSYIIKGGPGTGKSMLMKRIAEAFPDEDKELYYCSSSPDSLDAVLLKNKKIIIADGTSPHIFDAEYPGAVQSILNLGDYLDKKNLRADKVNIIEASAECKRHHARCQKYLAALSAIAENTYAIASSATQTEKLDGFISRLSKKLFAKKNAPLSGSITYKQISAVTKDGYITHIPEDCAVYLLNDPHFAGSELFLRKLAQEASSKGYDAAVSLCYPCPQNGSGIEHVILPELNTCFISSTVLNNVTVEGEDKKIVQFRRFYDKNIIASKKNRIKFNASAIENLCAEAVRSLNSAKEAHDRLESCYGKAADFSAIDGLTKALIDEIRDR